MVAEAGTGTVARFAAPGVLPGLEQIVRECAAVAGANQLNDALRPVPLPVDAVGAPGAVHGPVLPRHPSWMNSKSLALIARKAGFNWPLFHRVSNAPLMYMSEPVSATISP